MTATKSTTVFEQEHQVIQEVVVTMSRAAEALQGGHNVDPDILSDISIFLHTFSKECHHAKDDATQAFLTSGTKDALGITLSALVGLYVDHIWKEEYLLLPTADKVLSENDHAKLCGGQAPSNGTTLGKIGARSVKGKVK